MARRRKRRGRGIRNWILFGLTMLVLAGGLFLKGQLERPKDSGQEPVKAPTEEMESDSVQEEMSPLEVHYLDVGQGDATLLVCGEQALLVDAGDNSKGTQIQLYLKKLGIERLDYVIGTHPDADHIGGLDVILYKFDCGTIFMPEYGKETRTYEDVVQTLKTKGYSSVQPEIGSSYSLGSAVFTIVSPMGELSADANEASIGILVQHGQNRFLLTGDAQEEAEAAMLESALDLQADVYKAGHHGSKTSNTEAFLEAVKPNYAVISCGEGNSYGHPHAEVLNRFREMGIQVFRTDLQGTIVAHSDGETISFNMSPEESWIAGEPGKSE